MSLSWYSGTAKIPAIKDYVRGLLKANKKFIIFATHLDVIRGIEACVQKEQVGYMLIVGETPTNERRSGCERFQSNPDCRVAILSIGALVVSIKLTIYKINPFRSCITRYNAYSCIYCSFCWITLDSRINWTGLYFWILMVLMLSLGWRQSTQTWTE